MVNQNYKLTSDEKKVSMSLTALFSIRMLGLFIILPIFSVYARTLEGSTPFLAGLVFSSYALTQMLLQPLFGFLSDRLGRKITIITGLLLFAAGSLVIAFSNDIYVVLIGRIIQGSGAISAAVLALATDLTREAIRTKVMAMIGVSIGLTFGVAMFIAPILQGIIGSSGIFITCALLALAGIYLTVYIIPTPQAEAHYLKKGDLRSAFMNPDICRLYIGGFMIHLLLTMSFMGLPWLLKDLGYIESRHFLIYVPGFIISIVIMIPLVGIAERFYQHRLIFLLAILLMGVSLIILRVSLNTMYLVFVMALFFTGFNVLEATQPSLISRFAAVNNRGIVMGIFSSAQFLGASIGGIIGSLLVGYYSYSGVFLMAALLAGVWFILALPMQNPPRKV